TVSNSPSRFLQTAFLVPAARFLRPGFASFASLTPLRGGRSAESRTGACEAPVGPAHDAAGQSLARRLASFGGRSPPGAPPWRFLAPVPRFPSPAFAPDRSQRAPRTGS